MVDNPFTTITIPIELANKIKRRIAGSGFTSLSSYVTFVLREILAQDEDNSNDNENTPISEKEKNELLKRLKNLGYIG
ncbi:MAG: hypothetical protein ACTSWN_13250 [Promethearchaeota archaeon]